MKQEQNVLATACEGDWTFCPTSAQGFLRTIYGYYDLKA